MIGQTTEDDIRRRAKNQLRLDRATTFVAEDIETFLVLRFLNVGRAWMQRGVAIEDADQEEEK